MAQADSEERLMSPVSALDTGLPSGPHLLLQGNRPSLPGNTVT